MQELNLDVAGEFLVMAATLIHIKSRMLLPRPAAASRRRGRGGSARRAGPAAARAPEVQGGRRAAARARDGAQRAVDAARRRVAEIAGEAYEPELEVDLFSLLTAFQAVVERAKQRPKVLLPPEQISIEVRIEQLLARLSETEACGFEDCSPTSTTAAGLIVTFLALLEMIRLKLVRVFQTGSFGRFASTSARGRPTRPHPIGDSGRDMRCRAAR